MTNFTLMLAVIAEICLISIMASTDITIEFRIISSIGMVSLFIVLLRGE